MTDTNDPYTDDQGDPADLLIAVEDCVGMIPNPLWELLEQSLNGEIELTNAGLRAWIFDLTGKYR